MAEMSKQCPVCHSQLVFTPDGRQLTCDRCGYTSEVERATNSPEELAAVQAYTLSSADDTSRFRPHVRDVLRLGIAAAKRGDREEAQFYLETVLRKDSSSEEQAQAWLWLKETYDEESDQRECLRQSLALDPNNPLARRAMALLDGRLDPSEIIDPDTLASRPGEGTVATNAEQFRCPRCSAPLLYTPDGRALRCEFCEFRRPVEGANGDSKPSGAAGWGPLEQDFVAAMATARGHLHPVSARTMRCQGCAIEFTIGPEVLTVTCPYCASVYVTEAAEFLEIMPPHALIPFDIDQDQATNALNLWLQRHAIAASQLSPPVGIYLPVWTFDASGNLRWRGQERNGDGRVSVSGDYYLLEDDVCIPAMQRAPSALERLLPDFDMEKLVAYDPGFLADWPSERHQLALADASLLARKRILEVLRRHPEKLVGGRDITGIRLNSRGLSILSFKLVLLPVWMAHYHVEERDYPVVISGQTGNVVGDRPAGVVRKLISWLLG